MRINRRLLLVATCVVLLPTATPVQAASCKGKSHDMSLSAGSVAPGVGTTSTAFRFSTVYTDNAACPPVSITVTVSGVGTFPLSATGTMTSSGEVYARSMALPAGRRTYFFAATSGEGVSRGLVPAAQGQPGRGRDHGSDPDAAAQARDDGPHPSAGDPDARDTRSHPEAGHAGGHTPTGHPGADAGSRSADRHAHG